MLRRIFTFVFVALLVVVPFVAPHTTQAQDEEVLTIPVTLTWDTSSDFGDLLNPAPFIVGIFAESNGEMTIRLDKGVSSVGDAVSGTMDDFLSVFAQDFDEVFDDWEEFTHVTLADGAILLGNLSDEGYTGVLIADGLGYGSFRMELTETDGDIITLEGEMVFTYEAEPPLPPVPTGNQA